MNNQISEHVDHSIIRARRQSRQEKKWEHVWFPNKACTETSDYFLLALTGSHWMPGFLERIISHVSYI